MRKEELLAEDCQSFWKMESCCSTCKPSKLVLDLTSNLILKLKIKRLVYLEILYQSKA